jgi:hypothetical protein
VFWGRLLAGGDVIAAKGIGGGPMEIVSVGVNGPDQAPAANASNTAAFVGSSAVAGGNAIFITRRKQPELLVSAVGPFHLFSGAVSLNDSGEVAFHAVLDSGETGVYVSNKKGVTPFAVSTDDLRSPQRPVINNRGEVAFMATLANGASGIFMGQDPVSDKVVAVGDTIDGVLVDAIDFFRGLNDRGQIVFIAFMHEWHGKTIQGRSTSLMGAHRPTINDYFFALCFAHRAF